MKFVSTSAKTSLQHWRHHQFFRQPTRKNWTMKVVKIAVGQYQLSYFPNWQLVNLPFSIVIAFYVILALQLWDNIGRSKDTVWSQGWIQDFQIGKVPERKMSDNITLLHRISWNPLTSYTREVWLYHQIERTFIQQKRDTRTRRKIGPCLFVVYSAGDVRPILKNFTMSTCSFHTLYV